ncbi:hypothetical protein NHX12_002036 [Muraenolepis orangiensis]|uniref:Neural cell adhesion molecule 1-like n=1 Tax=Muraenolepis orangiensis TaxID=630683 RepID=A0A9Q0IHS8_9TELE|nr:hypothetical protein NHX12_002036 [Muraenolepis orangiensis]
MDRSALMLRMSVLLAFALMSGTDATINIINSKADLAVGDENLLLCKAGGEGGITWQKDGEDIDGEMLDETSSKLLISKAKLEDAGTYTCLVEFDSGQEGSADTKIYVYEGPSFGDNELYNEFLRGQEGVVPCLVSGQPDVEVRWLRDRQPITSDEGQRVRHLQTQNNSLHIADVRREDAGTYYCQATIRGRPIQKHLSISVVVNAPPTVHFKEAVKKVMAGPERNVSLLCLVDAQPTPSISWTMPGQFEPARHRYNSDRSELIILSVSRADHGDYICTATNKIGESNATIELDVYEAPEVFVSAEEEAVFLGQQVSLSCNVSGHPHPQRYWINKHSGKRVDSTSGRVRVQDGVLTIEEVAPSDGGLYSCMAVSAAGNASRDVAVHTQPGPPQDVSVSPEATSLVLSIKTPPLSGGTPIRRFFLQWRRAPAENWTEIAVLVSDPLAIMSLTAYTSYTVRLAASNKVGLGQFSAAHDVRTKGIHKMKVEGNSLTVPVVQLETGSSPLQHYKIRYRQEKDRTEWKEEQLSADATSVHLSDLAFGADYRLEVMAVNANGVSRPVKLNFTARPQAAANVTKGGVIAIVMVIFLVLLIVVDATCCYTNHCGLLMFINTKVFGRKFPGLKTVEEGDGANGGSIHQQQGVEKHTEEGRLNSDVTCDKAPLTKHHRGRGLSSDLGTRPPPDTFLLTSGT